MKLLATHNWLSDCLLVTFECKTRIVIVKTKALPKVKWNVLFSQMSGPRWMMQNEAGLFWRAKGNGTQALACLRQALHSAPPQHRDMPLVNTANLLLHYGLHDEAHELLQQALQINRSEVCTDSDL